MQVQQIAMQQPPTLPLRSAGWRGAVRADWAEQFSDVDPLLWMQEFPHELLRDRISRQVYHVHAPLGEVYIKVMTGTNDGAIEKPTLGSRLRWSLRPSRAVQTLRVCRRMLAAGIACPPPVLAARRWSSGMPTDVFISEAVEGVGVGDVLRDATDNASRIAMVHRLIPSIARLHQARFLHGDLLPNNLLTDETLEHVCFLDNDRTRRWPIGLADRLRRENVFQFAFRLFRYGEEVTCAFLAGYADAVGWDEPRGELLAQSMLRDIRERMERRADRRRARDDR